MSPNAQVFLPGVPQDHILKRLALSPGNEVGSGKLTSPASSAALAVNSIGWFIERPELFAPFRGLEEHFPAVSVDVEFEARFPWRGGLHPWLDGVVVTPTLLIGIESKRYEPYRDAKAANFSEAYDRPVWDGLEPFAQIKDDLKSGKLQYKHLDGAQLVKHALGLSASAARLGLRPALVYLYAEPIDVASSPKGLEAISRHRSEINDFSLRVADAMASFLALSYREWMTTWDLTIREIAAHADHVSSAYGL